MRRKIIFTDEHDIYGFIRGYDGEDGGAQVKCAEPNWAGEDRLGERNVDCVTMMKAHLD